LEVFFTPQAVDLLLVDHEAFFVAQVGPRPPVALAGVVGVVGPFVEPVTQPPVRIIGRVSLWGSLLGAAGLARDPTRQALAHAQTFLEHEHSAAAACRV